jgi:hypothetical protein
MKYLDIINLLLVIGILVQLYQPSPDLLVLLQDKHPPRHLHQPKAAQQSLHQEIVTVGSYVNVEDIIRYLHENPSHYEDNPQIVELIRDMQQTQKQLLETEENVLQTEAKLNEVAVSMYQLLSSQQQQQMTNQRNLDSVQQIEQKYWNELIEQMEVK